jgi:hypothetical protein
MKLRHVALALAIMGGFAQPAWAGECPKLMAKIDKALAGSPDLPKELLDEVKVLRADGEKQHAAGKHDKSVEALLQAVFLLGE